MFMAQMLQPMFETVKVDPLFGGGHGEEVMRSFMVQEYGKVLAKSGGFGVAAYIKSAMVQAQNKADAAAASGSHLLMPGAQTAAPTSSGVTP
jgi:Rod binding domain-containing protein